VLDRSALADEEDVVVNHFDQFPQFVGKLIVFVLSDQQGLPPRSAKCSLAASFQKEQRSEAMLREETAESP
jgi:hypothetical protein